MTELIIATFKFRIRDPDRLTVVLLHHPFIDVLPQTIPKHIRIVPQCPNPQFALQPILHTRDRILQTTITTLIRLDVPGLVKYIACRRCVGILTAGLGAGRVFALEAGHLGSML
jgi:hypothetical protein